MNTLRILLLLVGISLLGLTSLAAESWRFLTLADWHWAEKYVQAPQNPEWLQEAIAEDIAIVRMLKDNYGGELIMLPGDSNGGHWDSPAFIKKNFPGSTPEEAILKAGHLCYTGMINSFKQGGYDKLLMAIGDHELGDNPWPPNSAVARCQPQFRQAFAMAFNINPDGGKFRYNKPIGKAASQPYGTPYENTSYAYRHKNVLFVTVDVFHQESPSTVIGEEGTVTGTVVGKHLQWLENVLAEARKDPGIKHIIVQGHLAVIHPVRKVNSSGMLMDDGIYNPFWQLLRKYKVDLYFAGEVHANTATKDPESDLVQLVTRGNFFNNFQTVDITDDKIEVTCYNQKLGTQPADGDYSVSGRLVIDKSGTKTVFTNEGEFALFDTSGRHFHFTFEDKVTWAENPVMGLSGREGDKFSNEIRGIPCPNLIPNMGNFGSTYSALTANVDPVEGLRGKAGSFTENSRMGIFAMGPHYGDYAVSYALWVKSKSTGNQVLINSASCWGNKLSGFMNLNLNDGEPEVMISETQSLTARGVQLNDGNWHHIAVSMPFDGCKLSEVQVYVDGERVKTALKGNDEALSFTQSVRLGFGGLNYSTEAFDALPVEPLVGAMDEISIWTRPLSVSEIRELARHAGTQPDSSPVDILIHPRKVLRDGQVKPFGINVNYLRDEDRLWPKATRTIEEALKDMKVQWVRYPGGNKSDYYRFAKPPYQKADPVIYGTYREHRKKDLLDFDEFIELCQNIDALPWVVVPFEYTSQQQPNDDLLEHAVAWVRYANKQKGYHVKHWEIGNENWHPKHGMKNPERTIRAIEIARAMKQVDPTITIASSGIDFAIPGAREAIDIPSCSGYYYPFETHTFEDHYLNRKEPLVPKQYLDLERKGPDKDIAIVEWNYTYFKNRELPDKNDMGVAIGNVDAGAQVYIQADRLYNHIYWTTRWMEMEKRETYGSSYTLDDKNELTASGRAAWIIGNYFYPQAIEVECSDRDVRAYCFRDPKNRRMSLIYLNRSDQEKSIRAALGDGERIKTARHFQFAGKNYKDRHPVWEEVGISGRQDGNIPEVPMKGYSIVVIDTAY